ncbi:beta strand repeat-containing protein, partial [Flavobacterium croceum]|uniref:beta strand repeat-containing protein n=1 Tax=Flavobacterium croceum TaxID=370975 RepID=UPI003D097C39
MRKKIVLSFFTFIYLHICFAQNFLSNGNFENGGVGTGFAVTGVGYTQLIAPFSGTTTAGNYAITTNPQPLNTSNFISGTDHTTGSGNMLVIDGNSVAGQQYFWEAGNLGSGVSGLQPGSTYKFSYWIKSVSNTVTDAATSANINVQIDNATAVTLASGNAIAPLPNAGWQKVTYSFTATNTTVYIKLWNSNTNLVGNDFAIDDLSVSYPIAVTYSFGNTSCATTNDGFISIYGLYGDAPYVSYSISGAVNATNSSGVFSNLPTGTYTVFVTDSSGNTANQSGIVITSPSNPISVTGTNSVCLGNSATLNVTGGNTYSWTSSPTDTSLTTPTAASITVSPQVTTTYTVNAPVTNSRNLISNGDFNLNNAHFNTQYQYYFGSNPALNTKSYGIVTNPSAWNASFANCGDHTTGTGNMMVLKGSTLNAGNDVVWNQNVATTAGQSYTFSFWVQSLSATSPAQLEVLINNISVGTITAPATASCGNWTQFTYNWSSGSNVQARISIFDRNVSATGNSFAIDDISFVVQQTCNYTASKTVTVIPRPNFSLQNQVGCQGNSVTITPYNVTPGTYNYVWTVPSGATNPGNVMSFAATIAGDYTLQITDTTTGCASLVKTMTLTLNPTPTVAISGTTTICFGTSTTINFTGTPNAVVQFLSSTGLQYSITLNATGNATFTTPILNFTTTYSLYDVSLNGCTTTATGSATVTVKNLPYASIQATPISECQNYSPGPVVTFTGSNGTMPYTFTYTINGGAPQTISTTSTSNYVTLTVPTTTAGSFVYSITNVQDSGAISCNQNVSSSVTVTINPSSPVTLGVAGSVCPGTSGSFVITGPANAVVVLTTGSGAPISVILNASGSATYTTPALNNSTTYTLVSVNGVPSLCTISRTVVVSQNGCVKIEAGNQAYQNNISPICQPGECRDLTARYENIGSTSAYTVTSIPYCPQAAFSGTAANGFNSVSVNTDDVWSGPIPLPFNFCFFGNNYNTMNVGSNGVVAFGITTTGPTCPWSYSVTVPSTTFPIKNAIYGVYQDIDPSEAPTTGVASVNYKIDTSNPDCRKIIINFSNVPQFSCINSVGTQTSQIVIYETSNIVEVYVQKRTPCTTWNGGRGTIGIQNQAGTVGYTAPGRNASQWTATNEAWRFTPSGPSVVNFQWLVGTTPISTNTNITVCPTQTTTYTAQAVYSSCGQVIKTVKKDVLVEVFPDNLQTPINLTNCDPNHIFNLNQVIPSVVGSLNPADFDIAFHLTYDDARNIANSISNPTSYLCIGSSQTIYMSIIDLNTGCTRVRQFGLNVKPLLTPSISCGTNSPTSVEFNWNSVSNATGYNVSYQINSGTPVNVGTLGSNTTTYNVNSGVISNDQVTFTVTPTGPTTSCFGPSTLSCNAASCPTITNPSSTQNLCLGSDMNPLSVNTTFTGTDAISYVYFTSPQSGSSMYTGGIPLGYATPDAATLASYDPPVLGSVGSLPNSVGTYYIYAIANPIPADGTCRPYQEIVVVISTPPNAGFDGTLSICDTSTTAINLYNLIVGEDSGGTWIRTSGTGGLFDSVAATFTPAVGATNSTFEYSLPSTAICAGDTSIATVDISHQPTAGTGSTHQSCTTDTNTLTLANYISGEDTGGVWTQISGTGGTFNASSGTFIPTGATTSIFQYTITPGAPCSDTNSLVTINIPNPPTPITPTAYHVCDDNTDGYATFTLSTKDAEITGGNTNYTVTYHATQPAADAGTPVLPNSYSNNIANSQTVYVRVVDNTTGCYATTTLQLVVDQKPQVTTSSAGVCIGNNATVSTTVSPAGTYNYVWTYPSGASDPGNVSTFTTSVAGTYTVVATNTTTGCSSNATPVTVTIYPLPVIVTPSPMT